MGTNMTLGTSLVITAGIFSGVFAVPFKFNKKWEWENNWLLWSCVALIIMPWTLSVITIPRLFEIYQEESNATVIVLAFGILWGVGAILWGLGIKYLGIALSIPIMSGLNNSVGTLMPIVVRNPAELLKPEGLRIIAGVIVLLFGIATCSYAGSLKEKTSDNQASGSNNKSGYMAGVIICLLAGLIGPMINFGFVYGEPLKQKAIEFGASLTFSSNSIWSIVLSGGFLANLGYCIYLLRKRKTISNYKAGGPIYWLLALFAGALWYFSIMLYGMGGTNLGKSGASIGWATMQSVAIVAANVAGFASGEWKETNRKHMLTMFLGLGFLVCGIIIIAF